MKSKCLLYLRLFDVLLLIFVFLPSSSLLILTKRAMFIELKFLVMRFFWLIDRPVLYLTLVGLRGITIKEKSVHICYFFGSWRHFHY